LFIGIANFFISFSIAFILSHLIAGIWVPIMIATGLVMVIQRNKVAKYYLIGSLCYGSALVYYVIGHFILLPFQSSAEELVVVALAIDCFCIGLTLTEWLRQQHYQHQKAYAQSRVDSLTGLGNRFSFTEAIKQLGNQAYCIVFIDCDGLKTINDIKGHDEGDRFLKYTSQVMSNQLTSLGEIYRTGGDEFVWLLVIDNVDQLDAKTAQIDHKLETVEAQIINADWPESGLSFGAASSFECVNFSDCLRLADQRMYRHKRSKKAQKTNQGALI
jgi:diguanylate cyclase (GGDEF)-like protein